jgi:hypothetical protein
LLISSQISLSSSLSSTLYTLSIFINYERLIKGANLEQNYDEQLEEFRIQNGSWIGRFLYTNSDYICLLWKNIHTRQLWIRIQHP